MKKIYKFLCMAVCFALALPVFCGCAKVELPNYMVSLGFKENFKIMQLADIQAPDAASCEQAFVNIKALAMAEKPDLIVLTGDNIDACADQATFETLVSNMESLNTPWAPVYGNHDAEGVLTKEFMAEKFEAAENCLFRSGPEEVDGVGNYVVNLVKKGKAVYSIFLIDSNMYYGDEYDIIHPNQVEWYANSLDTLKKAYKKMPKSLAFFHIPLMEYNDARDAYLSGNASGWEELTEPICPGYKNSGFFDKVKEYGSTIAVACGHEHNNSCDIIYQGVHVVYGLKSSTCSYFDPTMQGATIFTLKSSGIEVVNKRFA